jgi:HAE1 family hydrophobic/amphiphilic exporter-1
MIILIVALVGLMSYRSLELAYMPSTDAPVAMVRTSYSGASPEVIEELITKPIEESLATLTGVDTISSTSSQGSSMVMVEFVDGTDLDMVAIDMREKIDQIKGRLPDDADDPTVMKMDMNATSISVGVTSTKYSDVNDLYTFLDNKVTAEFEKIEGISSVDIRGGTDDEIQITVDPTKLDNYGITISKIRQTLSAENSNVSSGEILQGDTDLSLRTIGEFKSINDIADLVITTSGGSTVHLKDVAEVKQVTKDKESKSLINGKEGVIYSLSKQSDANIVTVTDNILASMDEIEKDYPDLELIMLTTTADYIKTSVNNVVETAFQSALIAVLILLLFLRDIRTSIVIGISIPTSILATFALMYLKGMTMNTISMGGIVIGIGMLVDNSVVVLENIYKYHKDGYSAKEASEKGANEVAMAVTASTLTTIAVFAPLIFISGMIGTMLQDLSYTICFSLIASLFVSLTFVPMACSKLLATSDKKSNRDSAIRRLWEKIDRVWAIPFDFLDKVYEVFLRIALKFRLITLLIVIILFVVGVGIFSSLKMDLMSSTDEGSASISASMPDGTTYELKEEMLYKILDAVKPEEIPEVEMVFASVGGGGGMGGGGDVSVNLNLVDKEERTRSTDEIVADIRTKVQNIAGAEIQVSASSNAMGSMGGGSALSLDIKGAETDTLKEISDDLCDLIETIDGAYEVESSLDDAVTEGNIVLNRSKAAQYGITSSDLASTINAAISGTVATTYKIDDTEIDVRIKYEDDRIKYLNDLKDMKITTASGVSIPITEVADITTGESAVSISRENQQRYITLSAKFDGLSTSEVQALVQEKLDSYVFPDNYTYSFGGNMNMMNESFSDLYNAILVAILLVYMIMASQFESLVYPFIVMFSMPLAITGGAFGLFVTGQSLTVTAYMGFIMLVGMVVNNAIVLVDYANQLRERKGLNANEALLEAGPSRLRPILMTTLTTIIGLMPMAFATSSGMETQQPLGIAVIFGLGTSTLITLILIPVLYSLVNSVKNIIIAVKNKIFGE